MGLDTKIYWLNDRQSQCDFDFDEEPVIVSRSWEAVMERSSTERAKTVHALDRAATVIGLLFIQG
jgi:hypothetical protein